MTDLLHQARRRALRYWVEDGIPDLYTGILFLLFTGLRFLAQWAERQQQATWMAVGFFGSLAVILLGTLLGRFIIDAIKQRVTYPRTGYVAYAAPSKKERRKQMAFTLLLGLLLTGIVLVHPQPLLPFRLWALHLILFFLALTIAWQMGSPRFLFYSLVILFLVTGYHLTWERWSPSTQRLMTYGEITFLVLGVLMTLGGAFTLVRYLKQHPLAEEVS